MPPNALGVRRCKLMRLAEKSVASEGRLVACGIAPPVAFFARLQLSPISGGVSLEFVAKLRARPQFEGRYSGVTRFVFLSARALAYHDVCDAFFAFHVLRLIFESDPCPPCCVAGEIHGCSACLP